MDLKPPRQELQGVRAAVIGGSSGIGRVVALTLASSGADVIIHGNAHSREAEELAEQIKSSGSRASVVLADLTRREEATRAVWEVWETWGGIDAWLQFAGADILTGTGRHFNFEEKLDRLLAVDVVAGIQMTREVGRRMMAQGHGSIITMGWDQAETGLEGDSGELFAATKGAVMAFTRSLALSLAPKVRVNAIAPGWIKTAWGESASQTWQDRVMRETPLKRWGTPEDVAEVARFLASPAAAFLTGQIIRVNGGAVR